MIASRQCNFVRKIAGRFVNRPYGLLCRECIYAFRFPERETRPLWAEPMGVGNFAEICDIMEEMANTH